ncbi:MAG: hypothetical protein VKK42_09070 [Lyngbya sp.]|nr:hypothetical protein [Lyngbya sp.]
MSKIQKFFNNFSSKSMNLKKQIMQRKILDFINSPIVILLISMVLQMAPCSGDNTTDTRNTIDGDQVTTEVSDNSCNSQRETDPLMKNFTLDENQFQ